MAFDPLDSSKNRDRTEFGGSIGTPQPFIDGHVTLTPAEKRRMIQQETIASAGVMEDLPPDDAHYDAVLDLAEKRRRIYASGHTLDDALG